MNISITPRAKRIISLSLAGFFLLVIFGYLAVFGRALRQGDDHVGIALALPRVALNGGVAEIDPRTYVTTDGATFRSYMEEHGYTQIDQLGSTRFYEKLGTRYLATGRMYSAFFMVFHVYPEEMQ